MDYIRKQFDKMKNETEDQDPTGFLWAVSLVMELAVLLVASSNFDECPIDQKIPIFLIVNGCIGAVSVTGKLLALTYYKSEWIVARYLKRICDILELTSAIGGSVVIYRIYKPNYDEKIGLYCNKGVYLLGFSYLTMLWIIQIGFAVIIVIWLVFGYYSSHNQNWTLPVANENNTNRSSNHVAM